MGKVVVFGGSFNPPTKAHLNLGMWAVEFVEANKLCFLPVGDNYNKDTLIESKHRVSMLNILKNKFKNIQIDVDLTEVNSLENLNTIDSLNILQSKYLNDELYFLLGADNLNYLHEWKNADELLAKYKILAVRRDGFDIQDIVKQNPLLYKYKDNIVPISLENDIFISSTMVRESIVKGIDVRDYIDEDIESYIRNNKLYNNNN